MLENLYKTFFEKIVIYFIRKITSNTEELLFVILSFAILFYFLHIGKEDIALFPYNIEGKKNTWGEIEN